MIEEEDGRIKKGTINSCYCPDCGLRRIVWPHNQNVNSWADPKILWIHINGLRECND